MKNLLWGVLFAGALVVGGCAATEPAETAEAEAPADPGPVPTALPVVPTTLDHEVWLASPDPKLAMMKRKAYDLFRIIIRARHVDQADQYMAEDYIQHNPNANTGRAGFVDFFRTLGEPLEIQPTLPDLVSIQAEGDYVTLSFVREYDDPRRPGVKYTTTWFDTLRMGPDGLFVEHWDSALR